jgi:hypothetical protein
MAEGFINVISNDSGEATSRGQNARRIHECSVKR